MKIAYISGVKFGYDLLNNILENGWRICAVFSYSKEKRHKFSDAVDFEPITSKYNIKHIQVDNINDEENLRFLTNLKPDLILVMGWSQILKESILEIPKIGTIGSHPTELPKYRGRAPIPWSIIKKLKQSALTFFWMDSGIDNGDIFCQHKFNIDERDDATSLYRKITHLGKTMIIESLTQINNGVRIRIPQADSKFLEYWEKRTPEDGKINWSKSAEEINTLIRATTFPYPGAFTFYNDSKLIIWNSEYLNDNSVLPGKIIEIGKNGVKVGTGSGSILIHKISFKQHKKINSSEFFSQNDIEFTLGE